MPLWIVHALFFEFEADTIVKRGVLGFSDALLNLGHARKAGGKEEEAKQAWSRAVAASCDYESARDSPNKRIIMRMMPETKSLDEIIELYKRDVDVTLIDESLRRTVEERVRALEEFERFREEAQAALERRRDALR
jgi:hypothetical protein